MGNARDITIYHRAPTSVPIAAAWDGDDLTRLRFVDEVQRLALPQMIHDGFRGVVTPESLARLGTPVLVRTNADGEKIEALIRLPGGLPALVNRCGAWVHVEIAGSDRARLLPELGRVREILAAAPEPEPDTVTMSFWSLDREGRPSVRERAIEVPAWTDVARNYAAAVRASLEHQIGLCRPRGAGRLLLWRGVPGTGKTWALRALARAWRDWCSIHYVLDPPALVRSPPYLLELLTSSDDEDGRWRLLVLEDAGELLDRGGGAQLAPLLNVTDGILGQGTNTLILVTTNDPPGVLHPAVRRPGRCLVDLDFVALGVDEANAWLAAAGSDERVARPHTVAELFALAGGGDAADAGLVAEAAPFGFARALAERA